MRVSGPPRSARPSSWRPAVAVATQTATTEGLLMKSALFTWESVPEQPTEQGARRPSSPRRRPPSTNSNTTRRR